jgi:ATP-binding cassette subfamily C protein
MYAYAALLSGRHRFQVFILFLLMLLVGLTEGIGIMLLVPLLNLLNGQAAQEGIAHSLFSFLGFVGISPTAGGVLSVFVVLVALRSAMQFGRDYQSAHIQHEIVDRLRLSCFSALMNVQWKWLVNSRKSDQANLLLTDVSRVGTGLSFALSLLVTLVTVVTYLFVALALSWQMTFFAVLSGLLVLRLLAKQRRFAQQLGQSMGYANRGLHSNVQEALAGIKLAKILGNEQVHQTYFKHTVTTLRHQQLAFMTSTSLARSFLQFGGALLLAIYLYFGLNYSDTPVSELLILVLIFSRLIPMFSSAQQQYHHCLHAFPAFQETQNLLAECKQWAEPINDNLSFWSVQQSIRLKDVTINYEGRETPALNLVSMTFPANTTTAIMGASGAGKSTLADVLMGLLEPEYGVMSVDGVPVVCQARMRWRHSVAYVPQDVFLFHDTIRKNLLWGEAQASESELIKVLNLSAAQFVLHLPLSLDTIVGDGGVRLSGGERQRIALARALLRRPSLLILDEATSALDIENEARVRDAIENLHGDLTVVIIGHRLPTLEHADQVIVLDNGHVAKSGTWQDVKTRTYEST